MDKKRETVSGNLPVLIARGESIPEAWENSVFELYNNGLTYGREGPKDKGKQQTDSTMTIEIQKPLSQLFMHKGMTCSWEDLLEYQMEILGAKDSWVDPTEKSTRWEYHYHERLAGYPGKLVQVNQIEGIVSKLATEPFKRNINAITWVPERDLTSKDPPCLQRVWFTMIPGENGEQVLNMNYSFRSRNVMIASPMNQVGLATLHQYIADEVSKRTEQKIKIGRMVDFSDAYHVSARDQPLFKKFIDRFAPARERGEPIESRAYGIDMIYPMLEESKERIEEKILSTTEDILKEIGETHRLEEERTKVKSIGNIVMDINRRIYEGVI